MVYLTKLWAVRLWISSECHKTNEDLHNSIDLRIRALFLLSTKGRFRRQKRGCNPIPITTKQNESLSAWSNSMIINAFHTIHRENIKQIPSPIAHYLHIEAYLKFFFKLFFLVFMRVYEESSNFFCELFGIVNSVFEYLYIVLIHTYHRPSPTQRIGHV